MADNDIVLLHAVIETLGDISVKGYGNMSKLVGSINALQEIIQRNTEVKKDG